MAIKTSSVPAFSGDAATTTGIGGGAASLSAPASSVIGAAPSLNGAASSINGAASSVNVAAPCNIDAFHSAFHLFARQAALLPLDLSPANLSNINNNNNNNNYNNDNNNLSRSTCWEAAISPGAIKGKMTYAFSL